MSYSKQWLSEEEIRWIIELPNLDEKYEIWILLMYSSALRVTEAINVRCRDLNLEKREINIIGGKKRKSNEIEPVPCGIEVLRRIKRFCDRSDLKPSDFIMYSNKGKQVTRSWVYRKLNELCAEAKIDKKIGTHTLRRSRASHLLGKGVSLARVSKMLRHKNPATTMLYLKITTADIWRELDAVGDMDDIFKGAV
jgi:integrase/recombinase XerD